MRPNAGAVGVREAFIKTNKVFLIGESWLAHRRAPSRGNVQTSLEDAGFNVVNFAQNGITLSNFWWTKHMSWEKWQQVQECDAMVIAIGFGQISDSDMGADDEAELENIVREALKQSGHVIVIVPNLPLRQYFEVRASWYIGKQRDDLNEPDVAANAAKRQQLYACRFQKVLDVLKAIQDSNRALGMLEMQLVLKHADICDDGCHLSPQGATKAANAIAKALRGQDYGVKAQIGQHELRGKLLAYMWKAFLAAFVLKVLWPLTQRTRTLRCIQAYTSSAPAVPDRFVQQCLAVLPWWLW